MFKGFIWDTPRRRAWNSTQHTDQRPKKKKKRYHSTVKYHTAQTLGTMWEILSKWPQWPLLSERTREEAANFSCLRSPGSHTLLYHSWPCNRDRWLVRSSGSVGWRATPWGNCSRYESTENLPDRGYIRKDFLSQIWGNSRRLAGRNNNNNNNM